MFRRSEKALKKFKASEVCIRKVWFCKIVWFFNETEKLVQKMELSFDEKHELKFAGDMYQKINLKPDKVRKKVVFRTLYLNKTIKALISKFNKKPL